MAKVLGLSFGYHDAAASLVVDGVLIASMQEERFTRIKNDPSYPKYAIDACLKACGITAQDLDSVVFYEDAFLKTERVLVNAVKYFPVSWRQFPRAIASQFSDKIWVLDQISSRLNIPRNKISWVQHHLSHAASAFFPSAFDCAAILTVDGVGENATTSLWSGVGSEIKLLKSIAYPHSIGLLYAAITAYLGFEVNSGEYKVMGLAAFGQPRYKDEFNTLVTLYEDGSYELNMHYFAHHTDTDIGFSGALETLLGPRRDIAKKWNIEDSSEDKKYADIAATLQWITEEMLLNLARAAKALTGFDSLCIAGGVGLNCVANTRLLLESGFERVFVQPAAGDAGGALGAALHGSLSLGDKRIKPFSSCALGAEANSSRAVQICKELNINYSLPDDIHLEAAKLISAQKIIGYVHGRFEWGPRALGMRSILASPIDRQVRDRLNVIIKKREIFRPFAPAVLASEAMNWFETIDKDMSPYMTSVSRVRENKINEIGACVHVDGTSRVQTVTKENSEGLSHVLQHTHTMTGIPVLLNTSLNTNNEPIIASEIEAISFFLSTPIEAMVVGDVLIQR